jgi:hypothetical protein
MGGEYVDHSLEVLLQHFLSFYEILSAFTGFTGFTISGSSTYFDAILFSLVYLCVTVEKLFSFVENFSFGAL